MISRFLLALVFSFFLADASAQSICSYKYRKRITFDPARVAGANDLVNFPALINIASDLNLETVANGGHVENANGYDIIFTSADGVTFIPFQFESYSATTGQYTAYVKIPVLSTTVKTVIYMYYGNTAIASNQSSSSVWSDYSGVWHFQNNSFADESPNGYALTNNATTNLAAAVINNGRALNGSAWMEAPGTFPNKTTDFSISGWVYTTNNTIANQRIFTDDDNNTGGYALSLGDGGTGRLRFFSRGSTTINLDSPLNTIANNTWYYVTAVADITNGTRSIYVNGVLSASVAATGWSTDAGNTSIGGESALGTTTSRLNGRLDEVRMANSALSADWILTEYNNQNSTATFYTVSPEPNVWTGSNNTTWNATPNWSYGAKPSAYEDVIISNQTPANQASTSGNEQFISLWVQTGATLTLSGSDVISVAADVTNCGIIQGIGTSNLNMNATSPYYQTQHISGTGTYNLINLTINNTYSTSPAVVLNKNVNIASNLQLTSGVVSTTSTNILFLSFPATCSSGSSISYVSGPMSKNGNSTFIFPVGKNGLWRRIRVSGLTGVSTFRAEYFYATHPNTTATTTPLDNVSKNEYWQLDRLTGTANANVSLYWEDATFSGINNCADLTVARYNGTAWVEEDGTTVGGSSCTGTGTGIVMTNAVVTNFSPFTFGSTSSGLNPLPVELISFTSECKDEGVTLNWKTASERNNDYFLLEKSSDGFEWSESGKIPADLSDKGIRDYSYEDQGATDGVYYRLTQFDRGGASKVYPVIYGACTSTNDLMKFYPNPAANEITLDFLIAKARVSGTVKIINAMGQVCYEVPLNLIKGRNILALPLDLATGTYTILCKSDQTIFPPRKLIIK